MSMPIRILHCVVNMNRGGAETWLMNLYRRIDRSKVQFDFLTSREGAFDSEIEQMGGIVHRIPYISDVGHAAYQRHLDQFFSSHKQWKIVHSHMDKMSGWMLRSARKHEVPIRIAHSHNTRSEGNLPARLYKWYAGRTIRDCATNRFACSRAAARWLFPEQKDSSVIVVRNGIECEQFAGTPEVRQETREQLGLGDDLFVVGHVGRFNRQKNHSFLLDLFAELVRIKPSARLLLIGDGTLRSKIEAKIRQAGLEPYVKLLGVRSDVHRLLQAMDVFVFPSLHEGLPVTLVEAQAAGIPCVISSTITDEVDMGMGLISREHLSSAPGRWIEKIVRAARHTGCPIQPIQQRGYDIRQTASWLQDYYLQLAGGC